MVRVRRRCSIFAVAVTGGLAALGAAPSLTSAVTITPEHRWSLGDFGYKQRYYELPTRQGYLQRVFHVRLPRDARQGYGTWYLLDLRFTVTLSTPRKPGIAWITATTRGDAATQTRMRVPRRGNGAVTHVATWNLFGGYAVWKTKAHRVAVVSRNYLPNGAVRGGGLAIPIELARYYGVGIRSVRISNRSSIVATGTGPPQLHARADPPSNQVQVGRRFRLPIELSNTGIGTFDASVDLRSADQAFVDVRPRKLRLQRIAQSPVHDEFTVRPARVGLHSLVLYAHVSNGDIVGSRVTIRVHDPTGDSPTPFRRLILIVVFIPALCALAVNFALGRRRAKRVSG